MSIVIIMVIIDQLTKIWIANTTQPISIIPEILNFTYVENRGMVFGLAQGSVYLIGIISLILCVMILIHIFLERNKNHVVSFYWYMILAGGVSNIIDRFVRGYVIDFIDTPWIATFNLADTFIVLGVIGIFLNMLTKKNKSVE